MPPMYIIEHKFKVGDIVSTTTSVTPPRIIAYADDGYVVHFGKGEAWVLHQSRMVEAVGTFEIGPRPPISPSVFFCWYCTIYENLSDAEIQIGRLRAAYAYSIYDDLHDGTHFNHIIDDMFPDMADMPYGVEHYLVYNGETLTVIPPTDEHAIALAKLTDSRILHWIPTIER